HRRGARPRPPRRHAREPARRARRGSGRGPALDHRRDCRLRPPPARTAPRAHLRFDRATHALEAIRYEMDERSLLVLERTAGDIHAERAPLPYCAEVKGVAGGIERGLREGATGAGVPARVVSELADVFGWELDLESDLRPGDEFRVLYENTRQAGEAAAEPGDVIGAEINARGWELTAVFFEDDDGHGAYYRPSGEPLSREFLRYPLEFTEITSEFSPLREHPILRCPRPHLGVDFAAPPGTPVRAVASGTVVEAGWVHQLGRSVRVEHSGGLRSVYGHLRRIADGVREGMPVERGQVIGYVGSSGLSTGPHLHFVGSRRRVRRSVAAHGGSRPAPPRVGAAPLRSGAEGRHAAARHPAERRKPAHRLALHAGVPDGVGRRASSTVLARGSSPTAVPPDSSPRTLATLDRFRARERTLLAAEDPAVMARIRAAAPDVLTSFSAAEVAEFVFRLRDGRLAGYRPPGVALQVPPAFRDTAIVTAESVAA